MDRSIFATGALNVNPAEGEKVVGLAAVAMTMGEANVKGTQGDAEAAGGTFSTTASLAGARGAALEVELMAVVGGGGEKLKVGRLKVLMGREMAGRSGTSITSSSSGRLEEGRVEVLSLFILPPPEPVLLAAGVLDRG
jgi:hypothetical protein